MVYEYEKSVCYRFYNVNNLHDTRLKDVIES